MSENFALSNLARGNIASKACGLESFAVDNFTQDFLSLKTVALRLFLSMLVAVEVARTW